jgi:hypothetical protein
VPLVISVTVPLVISYGRAGLGSRQSGLWKLGIALAERDKTLTRQTANKNAMTRNRCDAIVFMLNPRTCESANEIGFEYPTEILSTFPWQIGNRRQKNGVVSSFEKRDQPRPQLHRNRGLWRLAARFPWVCTPRPHDERR